MQINAARGVVPQRLAPAGSSARGPALEIVAVNDKSVFVRGRTHGVRVVVEPEPSFADAPLIIEDLLLQARQLADSGAPTEAVRAILDHVAALLEGRG
ncbi:hypothetical protein brsh051_15670 [Brooklawnia propionicigenes]|uniref:Uncharacterized protein n=1 Tax=Brooklawnia propionicigenes TaxID=3041175 RepID=A0AAN0K884_9ACTN|nr:hypothetical protein [Brooklawnia sp. SH051]BEH02286.1 hypothetical protein brsh051_15670 [Brooklawnia sp. SH051]